MIKIENVNSPFMCYCAKVIPLAFDESMSYYECLCNFYNYLKNEVMPAINNNADATSELQGLVADMQEYMDNYFDNLNIQTEINNKLDAMALSGQLAEIINEEIFGELSTQVQANTGAIQTLTETTIPGINSNLTTVNSTLTVLNTNHYNIVAIGDSLVKGDEGAAYKGMANITDWLYQMTSQQVANKGVYGNTLQDVYDRLDDDVIALHPKYCIVEVGTNDINNSQETNPMILKANAIIEKLINNKIIPIMLAIPPRNDVINLNTYIREYNTKLMYRCTNYYNVPFIDIYSLLVSSSDNGKAKSNILRSVDNLHLTSQGCYEISKAIIDSGYIEEYSDFNTMANCRLWQRNAFDNPEIAIFTQDGDEYKANDHTLINSAGATFTKELRTDVKNTLGYDYNYQVITKPLTAGMTQAGISSRMASIYPGATVRFLVDYEYKVTDATNVADTYFGVEVNITENNVISYHRYCEAYNLTEAKGSFICDVLVPVNYQYLDFTQFVFGYSGVTLKISNIRAYPIS